MSSDENVPDPPDGRSDIPRLHERINPLLPIPAFFLVGAQAFHVLPVPAAYLVMLVGACAYSFNQRTNAPISRALPKIVLFVAVAFASSTVVIPQAWATPTTWLMLATIALTALITKDWATSLTSLAGISIFATGLGFITDAVKHSEGLRYGGIPVYAVGAVVMVFGALLLRYRHAGLFKRGGILDPLDASPVQHARLMTIGFLDSLYAVALIGEGRVVVAIFAGLASASMIGFSLACLFAKTAELDAGVMATILGVSITGLGVSAFNYGNLFAETIAISAGVAIAGGGISLIKSTGKFDNLRKWIRHVTSESDDLHHRP